MRFLIVYFIGYILADSWPIFIFFERYSSYLFNNIRNSKIVWETGKLWSLYMFFAICTKTNLASNSQRYLGEPLWLKQRTMQESAHSADFFVKRHFFNGNCHNSLSCVFPCIVHWVWNLKNKSLLPSNCDIRFKYRGIEYIYRIWLLYCIFFISSWSNSVLICF